MKNSILVTLAMLWMGFFMSAVAEEKWETVVYPVPVSFVERKGPAYMKELRPVDVYGVPMRVYDLQEWFKSEGMEFPEGSKAIYLREASLLLFKNNASNLSLFKRGEPGERSVPPTFVRLEFYLVNFRVSNAVLDKPLTYGKLREAAGDSWRVINVLSCLSKSGLRSSAASEEGGKEMSQRNDVTKLPVDANGATLDAEAVVGPDEMTIDVSYRYAFSGRSVEGETFDVNVEGSTSTGGGLFTIIQMAASGMDDRPSYAVLMYASVLLPGNMSLPPVEMNPTNK